NPPTEIEDKYISLDGYGNENNIRTSTFSYPDRFIDSYLRNISFVKNHLFNELDDNEDDLCHYITTVALCNLQIGSKAFLEIIHDLGKNKMINDKTRKLLPLLDFYKHLDLFKYFNDEHIDNEKALKHEKAFKDLLNHYPFLQIYYNSEIKKTRELYEEIMLRMCYYIYMIKFAKIPRNEKGEDMLLLKELNQQRNRIRKQNFLNDNDLLESEQNAITSFLSQFIVTNRKKKILTKSINNI
ncbi:MAG: hypothetical protein J6X02_01855, partial [Bacilli bacterium]|nr:hypothetical protein [Bacilli bacterium]